MGRAGSGRRDQRPSDAVDQATEQWHETWPDLDVSPLQVFGRLHRSYVRYAASLTDLFARHDINIASFDVLTALRRSGAPYRMTSRDLAESSLVSTGGVTLRVDRLEAAGLVTRERDVDDRRVVYVRLTDAGLDKIHTVAREHFANEADMLAGLEADERSELGSLLSRLETSIVTAKAPGPDPA
ncbi:MarR family winged helix-turn-helix transcriptional regulator [Tsukamurella pseudospumae]|uniref:MarR family transcriptional regulator n=1 Tax=Tsukamurella pseudospumae TaxID=239498 RepID=A0A138AU89_9ACTN|nr:MarR family transcriptional regulator [Tsukamurella pseudospumae]KXP14015.1 MarR family transcriptional regulator [Tsukamurella pseudospumae]